MACGATTRSMRRLGAWDQGLPRTPSERARTRARPSSTHGHGRHEMNSDTTALESLSGRTLHVVAPPTGRRTLSNRAGYRVAAAVIALGLFASLTPSPLYRTYSALWHFSPLTLTLIYATYALGVLAS